jgi:hypothetical protein
VIGEEDVRAVPQHEERDIRPQGEQPELPQLIGAVRFDEIAGRTADMERGMMLQGLVDLKAGSDQR